MNELKPIIILVHQILLLLYVYDIAWEEYMKSDLCFGIMEASALDMAGCVACALKFFFWVKFSCSPWTFIYELWHPSLFRIAKYICFKHIVGVNFAIQISCIKIDFFFLFCSRVMWPIFPEITVSFLVYLFLILIFLLWLCAALKGKSCLQIISGKIL